MKKRDAPDFFELDEHNLDREWKQQPELYHTYALKLADARERWEQAKADRDVVEAEQDLDVRRFPTKHDIEKITEAAVLRVVRLTMEYRRANDAVIKAKHEVDVLQAAVDALDHRKKALENLVHLHLSGYFATPRVRGEAGDEMHRRRASEDLSRRGN